MSFGACATHEQPPALTAADDQLAVEMNTQAQASVLANDTGFDPTSTVALVVLPAHGTASVGDDGLVSYMPAMDYLGDDSIDYEITNPGGETASATVAVTVGCATCAIGATVTLTWNPNAPGDMVQGYRLYMGATDDTSAMAKIDDIAVTRPGFDAAAPSAMYDGWTDLHLRIGAQVCFALTAYNANGESGFSNVACLTVTKTAMHVGV